MTLRPPRLLRAFAAAGGAALFSSCAGVQKELADIRRLEDTRAVAAPPLEALLRHPDWRVRRRAAVAAGRIQRGYTTELTKLAGDWDVQVRQAAVFALGQARIDEPEAASVEVASTLTAATENANPGVRRAAIEALGKTGGPGAEATLAVLLLGDDLEARREAASALFRLRYLKRIATYSPPAMAGLMRGLADEDPILRARCAYAFSRWPEPTTAAALGGLSTDPDRWVRLFALRSLAQLKDKAPLEPAVSGLTDVDERVRAEAAALLGAAGHVELIGEAAAKDASAHVRTAAAAALEGPQGSLDLLRRLDLDPSPMVRAQAALSLCRRMKDDYRIPILTRHLADKSWWVRSRVMLGAAEMPKEGLGILEKGLADMDVRVRASALEALGKRPEPRSEEVLAGVLKDPKSPLELRATAVEAAGARKSAALFPALEAAYAASMDRDFVEVRESAVDAAEAMAAAAPARADIASFRERFLQDPADSVRLKAARSLGRPAFPAPPPRPSHLLDVKPPQDGAIIVFQMEKGTVEIELASSAAPLHAANAAELVRQGVYDNTPWHRIVTNFVAQGGDPRGTGWGDAGYFLRDEINFLRFDRGVVGMPKAGKDTGGCQLFIALVPTPHLDGRYTAFGKVVKGMEVVDRLEPGDLILKARLR